MSAELVLRNLSNKLAPVTTYLSKRSPKILLATGLCGFVSTVVLAVKATPKAYSIHQDFEEARKEATKEDSKKLYLDECKQVLPGYVPALIVGTGSIACIIGSSHIQAKRGAAALAAYSLAEKTLETYQEKVMERLGGQEHKDIMQSVSDSMAEKQNSDVPFDEDYVYSVGNDGKTWIKDCVSGRYFRSTVEDIRMAEGAINKRLTTEGMVRLKDLYYELNLEDDTIIADAFGWESGRCPLDIYFTTVNANTPVEYLYMHYRWVVVSPKMLMG